PAAPITTADQLVRSQVAHVERKVVPVVEQTDQRTELAIEVCVHVVAAPRAFGDKRAEELDWQRFGRQPIFVGGTLAAVHPLEHLRELLDCLVVAAEAASDPHKKGIPQLIERVEVAVGGRWAERRI